MSHPKPLTQAEAFARLAELSNEFMAAIADRMHMADAAKTYRARAVQAAGRAEELRLAATPPTEDPA